MENDPHKLIPQFFSPLLVSAGISCMYPPPPIKDPLTLVNITFNVDEISFSAQSQQGSKTSWNITMTKFLKYRHVMERVRSSIVLVSFLYPETMETMVDWFICSISDLTSTYTQKL